MILCSVPKVIHFKSKWGCVVVCLSDDIYDEKSSKVSNTSQERKIRLKYENRGHVLNENSIDVRK